MPRGGVLHPPDVLDVVDVPEPIDGARRNLDFENERVHWLDAKEEPAPLPADGYERPGAAADGKCVPAMLNLTRPAKPVKRLAPDRFVTIISLASNGFFCPATERRTCMSTTPAANPPYEPTTDAEFRLPRTPTFRKTSPVSEPGRVCSKMTNRPPPLTECPDTFPSPERMTAELVILESSGRASVATSNETWTDGANGSAYSTPLERALRAPTVPRTITRCQGPQARALRKDSPVNLLHCLLPF